jgi:alkylation response protein AidB-like acyl-CoA dehydrogenase
VNDHDDKLSEALAVLEKHAEVADAESSWPAASWEALCRAGVPGWVIPRAYGGAGRDSIALLDGYGRLAGACLTTCFLLSQRDAACRRLRDHGPEPLCRELLPPLARGETFATVGLSQLTTSRQHGRPALTAALERDALILNGVMPWVTGAERADYFVTGAVLEDSRQVLAVVPRTAAGLRVEPPLELMALRGSLTAEVRCEDVVLDRKWLLAGPAERVMPPSHGAGSLETSALALGLAGAAVRFLKSEAATRPDWRTPADETEAARQALQATLHRLAKEGGRPDDAARLRAGANALVLRVTQLALAAGKGTGFLLSHPAQRWARQALFFLVWSCPRPALEATLTYLQPPGGV